MRRRRMLLAAVAVSLAAPSSALAGPIIDRAVAALRDDPVYVDPAAEPAIDQREADRLRERIRERVPGGVFVAVLPAAAREEVGGQTAQILPRLFRGVGARATYAVVAGGQFRAASAALRPGEAAVLATEAFDENRDQGLAATLLAFVDSVAEASESPNANEPGSPAVGDGDGDLGINPLVLFGLLAAGAGGVYLITRRARGRGVREPDFAEVKQVAQEDLLALADDIRALDLDIEMPGVDPRAKEDYGKAVEAYEEADRLIDRAREPEDLEPVTAAIDEGRYAMASAKARLEGREPPERRPPCFFDPRHGPSVRDVEWAPPGGAPRPVPACAADAQAVEEGLEPSAREVLVGGRRTPYWNAPPAFGPVMGGSFGGGLLPGLLVGTLLGTSLGGGVEDAHADVGAPDSGDFGDFGGGDFGDFGGGGGDLGGGGGDFGGGGGGDF